MTQKMNIHKISLHKKQMAVIKSFILFLIFFTHFMYQPQFLLLPLPPIGFLHVDEWLNLLVKRFCRLCISFVRVADV